MDQFAKKGQISDPVVLIFNHIASPVILPLTTRNTDLNPFAVRTVAQNRMASGSGKICGIHRRRDSSLLCLRLGNHIQCVRRAPAGQPVAAGDQQISDVAVMPLMKLTQHSLPHRGPLRASCSAWSTTNPPPTARLHVSAQCASNLTAILSLYVQDEGKSSVCRD